MSGTDEAGLTIAWDSRGEFRFIDDPGRADNRFVLYPGWTEIAIYGATFQDEDGTIWTVSADD